MNITLYNRDELFVFTLSLLPILRQRIISRVFSTLMVPMYCCHLDSLIFVNTYVSVTIQVWLSCV